MATGMFLCVTQLQLPSALAFRTAQELPELDTDRPVVWANPSVQYWLRSEDAPPVGIATLERTVMDSFGSWTAPTCSYLSLAYGGVTSAGVQPDDGYNTVTWIEDWTFRGLSPDVAATTDITFSRSSDGGEWRIADADILLNGRHYEWTTGAESPDARDIRAVITHEVGHLVGLLHPCGDADGGPACTDEDMAATMFPLYLGVSQRALGEDDVAGLCSLYPAESCETAGCPAGQACMDHRCVQDCADGACVTIPCSSDEDCVAGEICNRGACYGPSGRAGDPCADGGDCSSAECHAEGYCTTACGADGACSEGYACSSSSGVCASEGGVLGDACDVGEDCASGMCLVGSGAPGGCTRTCDRTMPCPPGFECTEVSGSDVCAIAESGGGGCAIASRASAEVQWLWVLCLLVMVIRRRGGRDAT